MCLGVKGYYICNLLSTQYWVQKFVFVLHNLLSTQYWVQKFVFVLHYIFITFCKYTCIKREQKRKQSVCIKMLTFKEYNERVCRYYLYYFCDCHLSLKFKIKSSKRIIKEHKKNYANKFNEKMHWTNSLKFLTDKIHRRV